MMPRRSPPDLSIEHSTFFKLLVVVNLTARPFARRHARRFGVGLTEWRVMLALASVHAATAVEICDRLGLDKMSVSRAVRALERRGRVLRAPDSTDRRRIVLTLTESGRALFADIAPMAQAREAALLAGFAAADRAAFDRLLDRLLAQARALPDDA